MFRSVIHSRYGRRRKQVQREVLSWRGEFPKSEATYVPLTMTVCRRITRDTRYLRGVKLSQYVNTMCNYS